MLEEGGEHLFLGSKKGEVGVNVRTIAAMVSAAKAHEFFGPEYTQCPAIEVITGSEDNTDQVHRSAA